MMVEVKLEAKGMQITSSSDANDVPGTNEKIK